jgi:hypothetical protein
MNGPQDPQGSGLLAALEWPGDVRDLPAPGGLAPFVWAAALVLVAAGIAFAARRPRARPSAVAATPAGPPVTALARLRALALPQDPAGLEPFYLAVKAVLRVHAHERFAVRSFVATSEELRQRLPSDEALDAALRACDQVLFGCARPDAEAHRHTLGRAEAWLVATAGAAL